MPHADSPHGIRAVLFDVDGTLVDTLPALIPGLGDTYERFTGIRPSEAWIKSIIGTPLSQQMRLLQLHEPDAQELEAMISYAIERFDFYQDRERAFGPAVQALIRLSHEGIYTGLVTSKSRIELESFLDRFEGAAFVDVAICASDVETPKPHPAAALLACERLNIAPREAVFIGDSIFDMRCARSAGIPAYAVTYGAGAHDALLAESPDQVFETPEDVYEWALKMSQTPCLEGSS